MDCARIAQLLTLAAAVTMTVAAAPGAFAQDRDIQTVYATEKGACGRGSETRVEIVQDYIIGPGFECKISNGRPAGTGLVAYDATCTIHGKEIKQSLALDLGNYSDHFELSVPGRDDWIKLYPCTPVPGLQ